MSTANILGTVGAIVGSFFGPVGAQIGWVIGSYIGGQIDPVEIQGPRLDDKKITTSALGESIPIVRGTARIAGNVIWAPDLVEVANEEESKGTNTETTTYTYYASAAVLICKGPIQGIRRVWANKRLIYDVGGGVVPDAEGIWAVVAGLSAGFTEASDIEGDIRFYLGTETQTADPLIVADKGSSPAYRGWAYMVIDTLNVTRHFGNRLPSFEFEVVEVGNQTIPDMSGMVDSSGSGGGNAGATDPYTGYIWTAYNEGGTPQKIHVKVTDPATNTLIAHIEHEDPDGGGGLSADNITLVGREFWVGNSTGGFISIFSATSYTWVEDMDCAWVGILRYEEHNAEVWNIRHSGLGNGQIMTINPSARVALEIFSVATGAEIQSGATDMKSVLLGPLPSALNPTAARYSAILAGDYVHLFPEPSTDHSAGPEFSITLPRPDYGFVGSRMAYDETRGKLLISANSAVTNDLLTLCLVNLGREEVYSFSATEVSLDAHSPRALSAIRGGDIVFSDALDFYYIRASGISEIDPEFGDFLLLEINPDTGALERVVDHYEEELLPGISPGSGNARGDNLLVLPNDSTKLAWVAFNATGFQVYGHYIPISAPLTPETVGLDEIVRDLCLEAGLEVADINVTQLANDEVMGFVVGRQMTARAAIEALQPAFFFDGVESDDTLKFVKRGNAIAVSIPEDDRAAAESGADLPYPLTITRAQEIEQPHTVEIKFWDAQRDYEINSAYARKITRGGVSAITLEMPITMTQLHASKVAAVNFALPWLKASYKWTTGRKYVKYEPTDVVTLVTDSASYNVRITKKSEMPSGIIEWEGVAEDAAIYTQNGVVSGTSDYAYQTITPPATALLYLMDIPILRDDDDDPGFYAAHAVIGSTQGARLYQSSDGGSSYSHIKTFIDETITGVAVTALANSGKGNVFDYENTVDVVVNDGDELSSDSKINVLNGYNGALLGDELIQFITATLVSANRYRLSGILRGRMGTEWAMDEHAMGERFVLVSLNSWRRIAQNLSSIGLERHYKCVAETSNLSNTDAEAFTNNGAGLKPYAGCRLRGSRDGGGDLTITWLRRTRIGGGWRDAIDVPVGEDTEEYEIDIIGTGSPDTVLRTLTGMTAESATYTAAQQVTDFGSAQSEVTVKVYQLSADVGRGYPLEGRI